MRVLLILFLFIGIGDLHAQQKDSIIYSADTYFQDASFPDVYSRDLTPGDTKTVSTNQVSSEPARYKLTMKRMIIPVTLITYGFVSQSSHKLKAFDVRIKKVVRRDPDFHTCIDNYLQYAPGFAVFGLNAVGIKGKNNFRDRASIYLLSNLMMGITVQTIKKISKVPRPEGWGTNAFPSGHTGTAFVGAEFLRQEYKDVSPWYGVTGYLMATTTGVLRMFNNKHWFRDVVAGAGFGILATDAAYWLEPIIAKKLFHKRQDYHFNPAAY
ncbi:MAG: phosphatase PAP2 family protein [Bacteroidota bacterium]|nr:phosphatase PAP2 family protein [Bacteroidota bacterium]